MKLSGKRPSNLGATQGKLAPCSHKPNCVSSQASDALHAIEPVSFTGDSAAAMARLEKIIADMPRSKIVASKDNYLYAECSTALLGFVDDVEFFCDGKVIHARSASRLGYSDFSVNRKRIETIRAAFNSPN